MESNHQRALARKAEAVEVRTSLLALIGDGFDVAVQVARNSCVKVTLCVNFRNRDRAGRADAQNAEA